MLHNKVEERFKPASQFNRLGKAIQWLRQEAELRQNEVAGRAGITKAMISSYESGRSQPTVATLDKILAAIGADMYELCDALDLVNDRKRRLQRAAMVPGTNAGGQALEALQLGTLAPGEEEAFQQMLDGFRRWLQFLRSTAPGARVAPVAGRMRS